MSGLPPKFAEVLEATTDLYSRALDLYLFITKHHAGEDSLAANFAEHLAGRANILEANTLACCNAQQELSHYIAAEADSHGDACESAMQFCLDVRMAFAAVWNGKFTAEKMAFAYSANSVAERWPELRQRFAAIQQPDDSLKERLRIQLHKAGKYALSMGVTSSKTKAKPAKAKPGPKPPTADEIQEMQAIQRDWLAYTNHCRKNHIKLVEGEAWQKWRTKHGKSDQKLSLEYVTKVRKRYKEWVRDHSEHEV
jgi:hypothetical protein